MERIFQDVIIMMKRFFFILLVFLCVAPKRMVAGT